VAEQYRIRHDGPCLVAGAAPTVRSDVQRARQLFPNAPIYGANSACNLFPEIEHTWTQHARCVSDIKAKCPGVKVHARGRTFKERHLSITLSDADWAMLDYAWPSLDWVDGTSGVGAVLWARWGLGHSPVIVCGVALDPDSNTYADGYPWPMRGMDGTVWQDPRGDTFDVWRSLVDAHNKAGRLQGVRAMSGYLKTLVGEP
jgi:hypothetical protein